ncbi:hydrolase, alpha/beta domain protein [Corynebacterium sp. CMW7794]|uniref:alpha/beta fold hydrolase n=1 Tax=Corynebacterium TaxID=1716 RepID=UPI00079539BF|nr:MULTISPECIES: alpha/beta hydrolase [Corynebacterium]KXI19538.1 hydrolase, alpha/beta domain protein [Corynebacterium sp. CMW7794]MBF9011042.1 alpha/beta hydrolase [Corynebacterium phoceense]
MNSPSVVELDGPWRHEMLHTRGIRLHAATLGRANDPLIVCIHGSIGGWFDYKDVLEPLAAAGHHVAAVDLRGYGMSDKPPVDAGQDMRTLIGDITGLIQALGHDSATLIGNDTGAALAWCVACERPERVDAVVSVSGAHPVDLRRAIAARPWDFGWLLLRTVVFRLPLPIVRVLVKNPRIGLDTKLNTLTQGPAEEANQHLREQAMAIDHSLRGTVWNHRLLTAPIPRAGLDAKAQAPVLFVHASQRLWWPVIRRARRRAESLVTAYIPKTKNLPHIENPEKFARTVTLWLGRYRRNHN